MTKETFDLLIRYIDERIANETSGLLSGDGISLEAMEMRDELKSMLVSPNDQVERTQKGAKRNE